MLGKRWRQGAVLSTAIASCIVAVGATSESADAYNRCTRYFGFDKGVWVSSAVLCPSYTNDELKGTDGVWESTDSTARRDENWNYSFQASVCAPLRLRVQYSNGSGAHMSTGCADGVWDVYSSNGLFVKAQCRLSHDDAQWTTRYLDCETHWTS
jgi:hypothetical protein